MAYDYASSILGKYIRVTSLDTDGTAVLGAEATYQTPAIISVSFTPEYEEGDEFTQKAADGTVCVTFKAPDTLKRVTLEVAVCDPDPMLTEKLAGGVLLTDGVDGAGDPVGWAAPNIGEDAMPNGVAVEVWSQAVVNGKPAATNPYWHFIFPYAVLRQGGDRVIENGILGTSFEGWGVGNDAFDGALAPVWPYQTDRAYAYARTATVPTTRGYVDTTPVTP